MGVEITNQEKDLKNAREFKISYQNFNMHRPVYQDMIQMLSDYVQWLEQKGVIKFTGNRNNTEDFQFIKCTNCGIKNLHSNYNCYACDNPIPQ